MGIVYVFTVITSFDADMITVLKLVFLKKGSQKVISISMLYLALFLFFAFEAEIQDGH